MKVFSSGALRAADQYTIRHTPISSTDLMERAATLWAMQFVEDYPDTSPRVYVICGPGNNGGDGLVIARWLVEHEYEVEVWLPDIGGQPSPDFTINLERLPTRQGISIQEIKNTSSLPRLAESHYCIDALLGSGLSRPITGIGAALVRHLNRHSRCTVAVDIPSGLPADRPPAGPVMQCQRTYTFQAPKQTLLLDDYYRYSGEWKVLDIGLSTEFLDQLRTDDFMLDLPLVQSLYRPRFVTGHKGSFGHAGLVAGSYGKIGAALLSARACLRSGTGRVTLHLPGCGGIPLHTALPEALLSPDPHNYCVTSIPTSSLYSAYGIGPGLGTNLLTARALRSFLQEVEAPVLLDADALNLLAQDKALLSLLPERSILTPHPKEFSRLFGSGTTAVDTLRIQREESIRHGIYILYKSHYSRVSTPEGLVYFNSTGNNGMATAGSGDVLTGIITGLLAQGYSPIGGSLLGMYIHGLAGDIATEAVGRHALIAGDITEHLGAAFRVLSYRDT